MPTGRLLRGKWLQSIVGGQDLFAVVSSISLPLPILFIAYRFDPHFNAITGLNGSGKSNILDSICFVLGITNLSQVRAGNLSELVYKQGQAGVTKASVTVVFNNEDPSNSPVGYEQCSEVTVTRQVLLGGKSKYLINGRNSPAGQVQNLFHSVQLNVNNPHFLIMQGRITKVLNMKPNEILGMVEEAAGTRMYETKRVAAIKTIDKKQAKVDELNSVLSEEITPTLERLRGEKHSYLKWSKNNADIERIERFVVASDFMKAQQALDTNVEGSSEMEDRVAALEAEAEAYTKKIEELSDSAKETSAKLKGEFADSHSKLKKEEEKLSKQLVKTTSAWQNSQALSTKADTDLNAARVLLNESSEAFSEKEREIARESTSIEQIIVTKEEAEKELERLTSDFQNMSAGLTLSQGDEGMTLPDQIAKAHSDSKTAQAKVQQATMKIKHLKKELEVSFTVTATARSRTLPQLETFYFLTVSACFVLFRGIVNRESARQRTQISRNSQYETASFNPKAGEIANHPVRPRFRPRRLQSIGARKRSAGHLRRRTESFGRDPDCSTWKSSFLQIR